MPYKDNAKRNAAMAAWKKKNYTPAYMQWLYQRRKLHSNVAAIHEQALLLIARTMGTKEAKAAEAETALHNAEVLRRKVGNRFDHENNRPYYKE